MEPFPALEYLPLRSDALRLDRICPADLVRLRRMEEEEDFQRVTCRPVRTRTDEELLEQYQTALSQRTLLIAGLYLPEQDEPIGKLTAGDYNPRNGSAELGYYLAPAYRGNGCMAKALNAFCACLFQTFGLNKVYAQTGAFNQSSVRLLERTGFQRDGVLRQHHPWNGVLWDDYLYSLLAKDLTA
ncbi:GNAT family protein [Flavonifractor sp. AGMB03687]|uniref:GNAT family N-acetyltransferase n=1 Tax=Flavonifractor sp. AGMB03687 TaxID=2785133 RepID=UPI001ADF0A12|nr:GNAT family protein [Flavonifractor sp. AGMB03687]